MIALAWIAALCGNAAGLAVAVEPSQPSAGDPTEPFSRLARHIPADATGIYFVQPADRSDAGNSAASASRPTTPPWLALLGISGLIGGEGALLADLVETLPLLSRFPHSGVLLDLQVRSGPGASSSSQPSVRLDRLQYGLIFLTKGDNAAVLEHLNRLLPRYTNREQAAISEQPVGTQRYFRLVDRRFPKWAVLEWGRLDDAYAVCIGDGSFERLHAAGAAGGAALADDEWFRGAVRVAPGRPVLTWLTDLAALRERIAPLAGPRWNAVLNELGLSAMDRDAWSFGIAGRAVTCGRVTRVGRRDRRMVYSRPLSAEAERAIPPGARHYAVIRGVGRWLIGHAPAAWVQARYFRGMDRVREWWGALQAEHGFDAERDLLGRLGDDLIICDDPPHPLGLPIAVTLAIAVREPDEVRRILDAVLGAFAQRLDEARAADDVWALLTRVRLKRAADGVWYVQMGVLGPAMCVTSEYLVISWSPQAVREAAAFFGGAPASAPR